jgi:hypothetical protein
MRFARQQKPVLATRTNRFWPSGCLLIPASVQCIKCYDARL